MHIKAVIALAAMRTQGHRDDLREGRRLPIVLGEEVVGIGKSHQTGVESMTHLMEEVGGFFANMDDDTPARLAPKAVA